ncbi:MAG: ORF6N domain-containing protein [Petrimonas sp.]|nr:ORF6N domain-containing protein [Petrimonas sp.]
MENNPLLIIENKIYEIRGVKVMLDFDLAEMYGMKTGQLKRSVRRNIKRFEGDDFMFTLNQSEVKSLENSIRCQNGILPPGGIKFAPFAFTELGVAMLSSVLNSEIAIEVNRNIMRAFTAMRQLLQTPPDSDVKVLQREFRTLKEYIEEMFSDQNDINEDTRVQIELISEAIAELQIKNASVKLSEVGYLATLKRQKK